MGGGWGIVELQHYANRKRRSSSSKADAIGASGDGDERSGDGEKKIGFSVYEEKRATRERDQNRCHFSKRVPWCHRLEIEGVGLTPYEKKKYVWKMLYIYMLGYDADFGHMEVVSLISAPKYPEKQVGNIGGREFAESLAPDVQRLLILEISKVWKQSKALNDWFRGMSSADADMKYPSDKIVEEDSKKSEKKKKSRKKNEKESDVLEVSDVTNRETFVGGVSENGMDFDGSELKSGKNRKMGKKRKKSYPMKDSDFGEALDGQGKMNLDETELESEKTSISSSSKETTKKIRENKKQKGKSSKLVTLDTAAKSSESLGNEESEDLGSNKYDRKRRIDDNVEAEKYGHKEKSQASI
ncbi:hypothetical protein J5N97_010259 [Dioscorea zingiberensis]|uniref:Uncharacterized protein n=1 Tax=Dioscorea zingiberensis TaxID=325984 RepID=A0A9D5CZR5_9LILI|nr:hypothetical protein J5N97_010259 [Dioscorea zingiberensis]